MNKFKLLVMLIGTVTGLLGYSIGSVQANTIILYPVVSGNAYQDYAHTFSGTSVSDHMATGFQASGHIDYSGLVEFDLSSLAGATVTSATYKVFVDWAAMGPTGTERSNINLYSIPADGAITLGDLISVAYNSGSPVLMVAQGTPVVSGNVFSPNVTNLVSDALSNSRTGLEFRLSQEPKLSGDDLNYNNDIGFLGKTGTQYETTLTVNYVVPEPTPLTLLAVGCVLMGFWRRRAV